MSEYQMPEPDAWAKESELADSRLHYQSFNGWLMKYDCDTPLYTAATLRQAVKRANYELLMRLHEENKHKHNFFHCAAVKLMEDSK